MTTLRQILLTSRSSDLILTSKVKATFIDAKDLQANVVKVARPKFADVKKQLDAIRTLNETEAREQFGFAAAEVQDLGARFDQLADDRVVAAGEDALALEELPRGEEALGVATLPFVIAVRPGIPATIPEFVALAKSRPGQLNYGTNGPSSFNNIVAVLVSEALGIRMQDVTYRGDAAQLNDFVAGTLEAAVGVFHSGVGRIHKLLLRTSPSSAVPQKP